LVRLVMVQVVAPVVREVAPPGVVVPPLPAGGVHDGAASVLPAVPVTAVGGSGTSIDGADHTRPWPAAKPLPSSAGASTVIRHLTADASDLDTGTRLTLRGILLVAHPLGEGRSAIESAPDSPQALHRFTITGPG